MRTTLVLRVWATAALALAGCARATTGQGDAVEGTSLGVGAADAAADAAASSRRRRAPDLVLALPESGDAVTFSHRDIAEDSCEIYEGCALGSGRRAAAEVHVTVKNLGGAALELGAPWSSDAFYPSLCQHTQTLYGFISAEVRDANNALVTSGLMSTSCVADVHGGYSCVAQGLSPGGSATGQPQSQCDYVDMTRLPSGDYQLTLTVNPHGELSESTRSNNSLHVPFHYIQCDGTICGGGCCPEGVECRAGVCQLPDLRVNAESAEQSLWVNHRTFDADSCEIEEMCVSGSGRRRLLNFEGRIENVGPGDLAPGEEHDNPLFEFSSCHEHYHFRDFTDYQLLDRNGAVVAQGHKQSFCLISMVPVDVDDTPAPPGTRPEPNPEPLVWEEPGRPGGGGCNFLQSGWADIYSVGTPCQWVDITDVPEGDYVLKLSVNPQGRVAETDLSNNTVELPVHLNADVPCVPQSEICGDAIDQDCDEQPDIWDEDCNEGCYPGSPFCEPTTSVSNNNSCGSAYELTAVGTYTGQLPSGDSSVPASCGGAGGAAYFHFTLDVEQVVYVGALDSALDTVVGVYRDDCAGAPLHCADDSCGTRSGHFVEVLPAGSYVIEVRAKQAGQGGRYALKFQHDNAQGAIVLQGPGVYRGDTSRSENRSATCEGYGAEPDFGSGPEDRYVLASCNSQVTLSTCGASTFHSVIEARQVSVDPYFEPLQCAVPGDYACRGDAFGATLYAYAPSSGLTFITVDGTTAAEMGEYQLTVAY